MVNNSSSFKNKSSQRFGIVDANSSASVFEELSKLGVPAEVNEFATRIKQFHDNIQQFQTNFESGPTKSENEAQCVLFCDDLLQEHIKSLDKYINCLRENNSLSERLNELNHRVKELERLLWLEKESKNHLKKRFEEDEQQNLDESRERERQIDDLRTRLKSAEKDKKKLYNENQDLLCQYQTDLTNFEEERTQLKLLNKKLIEKRELDELQSLNNLNAATNLANELCALLNLASTYRQKGAFFGCQFIATFDMVFGCFKPNRANVTFLDMQATSEQDPNRSVLSLLSDFNIILKENLIQNDGDSIRPNHLRIGSTIVEQSDDALSVNEFSNAGDYANHTRLESQIEFSPTDSHSNEPDTDTDSNLMNLIHLTTVNNLPSVFIELSGNQNLNSTVKTNEERSREPHSTRSSNLRLFEDDDLEPVDDQKPDESDPFFTYSFFLYLFSPLFLVLTNYFFLAYHSPHLRIYYSNWEEVASNLLSRFGF